MGIYRGVPRIARNRDIRNKSIFGMNDDGPAFIIRCRGSVKTGKESAIIDFLLGHRDDITARHRHASDLLL